MYQGAPCVATPFALAQPGLQKFIRGANGNLIGLALRGHSTGRSEQLLPPVQGDRIGLLALGKKSEVDPFTIAM